MTIVVGPDRVPQTTKLDLVDPVGHCTWVLYAYVRAVQIDPIALMIGTVVMQACEDFSVEALWLAIRFAET